MNFIRRCWAEVSIDNLLSNYNRICSSVNARVMCVVKANAYGHGDTVVARELENAGVCNFAVASMSEALHLRKSGITSDIMLLGGCLDDCFPYAAKHGITLTVYDYDFARRLSDYAISQSKQVKVHIKLNTGMSRIGFDCTDDRGCEDTAKLIEKMQKLSGIIIEGVFTHFSTSDEETGKEFTLNQFSRFTQVKSILEEKNINISLWHASNSGAIVNYPECHLDMVGAGSVLYGMYNGYGASDDYKSVMSLKTVITQIHTLKKGDSVSYGRTFTADRSITVATVSIGYGDGYPRSLSSKGYMLVNGKKAAVIGRVCMDQTVIDVTDIDCKVGDTVTVMGKDGNFSITAEDIANLDSTINYEIVCGFSSRIPRVYLKDDKHFVITEYI